MNDRTPALHASGSHARRVQLSVFYSRRFSLRQAYLELGFLFSLLQKRSLLTCSSSHQARRLDMPRQCLGSALLTCTMLISKPDSTTHAHKPWQNAQPPATQSRPGHSWKTSTHRHDASTSGNAAVRIIPRKTLAGEAGAAALCRHSGCPASVAAATGRAGQRPWL